MLFEDFRRSAREVYKEFNKSTPNKVDIPDDTQLFHSLLAFEAYFRQMLRDGYLDVEVYESEEGESSWDDFLDR